MSANDREAAIENPDARSEAPDPLQGHTREWPSTPYSDEARAPEPPIETSCCIGLIADWEVEKLKDLFGATLPGPAREALERPGTHA